MISDILNKIWISLPYNREHKVEEKFLWLLKLFQFVFFFPVKPKTLAAMQRCWFIADFMFVCFPEDKWCTVVDWLTSLGWSSIHHCPSLSPCCLFGLLREWIGNSTALVSKYIRVYCSLPQVWAYLFPNSLLHASQSNTTLNPRDNSTVNKNSQQHMDKLHITYICNIHFSF